jgi:hypothetical protein
MWDGSNTPAFQNHINQQTPDDDYQAALSNDG